MAENIGNDKPPPYNPTVPPVDEGQPQNQAAPPMYSPQQPEGAYPPKYAPNEPLPKYQSMPPYSDQQGQQYPTNYGATTVIQQPTMVTTVTHIFSNQPTMLQCPNCHQMVTTVVCHQTGTLAWLLCLIMMIFGLWLCCWIPFVIDDLKDTIHICPRCRAQLGRFQRM